MRGAKAAFTASWISGTARKRTLRSTGAARAARTRAWVAPGPPHETIQRRAEPRPPLEQLGLREAGRGAPEARPPPVLVAAEAEQLRLEAVVVAPEDRLAPTDLRDEARDLGERPDEVVVGVPGRGEAAERGHLLR